MVETIADIAQKALEGEPYFVVMADQKGQIIRVILDGYNGIPIDRCARLARKIYKEAELMGLNLDDYQLDVGSPGLDRPLMDDRQFQANVGRLVRVETNDNERLEGRLVAFGNGKMYLKDDEIIQIDKENTRKCIVELEI